MYLTILWFSLNCLSFFELYVQDYIDSLRMKRLIRLLHLLFEFVFHLAVKLYFPFSFGKTNYLFKIICPLSVRFYSNLSSIRLSKIMCHLGWFAFYSHSIVRCPWVSAHFPECWLSALPTGRSGWTRTIDLALIRRAL